MKLEELKKFDVIGNGVVVCAVRRKLPNGILMPDGAEMTMENTKFFIVKAGEDVTHLKADQEVLVAGAAFIPLIVEDRQTDHAYFFTPAPFIKMVLRDDGKE